MTINSERWCLFQVYDLTTERWSPVYSAPTLAAAKLECADLFSNRKNQPFIMRCLGTIHDSKFRESEERDFQFGKLEEVSDEISAAESSI